MLNKQARIIPMMKIRHLVIPIKSRKIPLLILATKLALRTVTIPPQDPAYLETKIQTLEMVVSPTRNLLLLVASSLPVLRHPDVVHFLKVLEGLKKVSKL